ncbi:uncharacterized protein CC84DRAFT_363478 [Paraphaeosphaeria sporulosa]|uniref:Uncharacterized protein n=1 Tax=Paraphaeosphaeria sporulosa TaxID=1460663 RepID=A0A177BZ17_9PLEO|nr:uncharacterized protein CC84DRAFT_363478 [Paraphaeosphaeria sporulosa]OAG00211.1 hypothetical protein CC84DRAFT_363478 [Paraphaeosphaeria sporulosa]
MPRLAAPPCQHLPNPCLVFHVRACGLVIPAPRLSSARMRAWTLSRCRLLGEGEHRRYSNRSSVKPYSNPVRSSTDCYTYDWQRPRLALGVHVAANGRPCSLLSSMRDQSWTSVTSGAYSTPRPVEPRLVDWVWTQAALRAATHVYLAQERGRLGGENAKQVRDGELPCHETKANVNIRNSHSPVLAISIFMAPLISFVPLSCTYDSSTHVTLHVYVPLVQSSIAVSAQ